MAAVLDAHRQGALLALRTSGTSGRPRTVVRSAESWFCSFDHVTRLLAMSPTSRVWIPGPVTSTMNLFAAVHAAQLGADGAHAPADATHAVLTPAALARLLAQDGDLTDLHVLVAGDALTRGLRDAALSSGASRLSHYYGAAELSFVAWGSHAGDLVPFPGVEVEARDGEIWVRSAYLCRGYAGREGPMRLDDAGWATVGDRGSVRDGFVRVSGRGGDTVVTAGATVFTGDVEDALEQATGTRPVVVGVPHPDLGAVVCALLTAPGSAKGLRSAARRVLPAAARPRRWYLLDAPPLTEAGKIDRARLVELLAHSEEGFPRA